MPKICGANLLLDYTHTRAICDEIGWRLRAILKPDAAELPPRLLALVEKLAQQEISNDVPLVLAPSSAPSLEEMQLLYSGSLSRPPVWRRLPPIRDQVLPTPPLDR
jgi:hypothetical protein